ncbi:MAG TPA: TonB-dependent receptor [Steroidobacteraceae bacterium]
MHRSIRVTALAALAATPFCLSGLALAQTADTEDQGLQEVVVTGSLIHRTDTETPSPVQVMSAEQIQQSGYTDISEILRNITANGANTLSQSFGQAFAAGASGVSLRGLTVGDTLVLIDGQRMVAYPLPDDNQRSFVDVSDIPINAIEQVQVLKDGASALYGADAIGGVVNVILKKSYTGFSITGEAGESSHHDGGLEHVAVIGGMGDLASDGWNAYFTVDFHHQDQILASNRTGLWTALNWTPEGGFNTTPGACAGGGANCDGNVAFPATITGYLGGLTGGAFNGNITGYLPGCTAALQAANGCEYTLPQMQLQPKTENINMLAKFSKDLGNGWTGSVTGSMFNSQAQQVAFNYTADGFSSGLVNIAFSGQQQIPSLVPFPPLLITVPANYPGNTTGADAALDYNFHELGLPMTLTDTNTYRLVFDVTGKTMGWDLDLSAGLMYARMDEELTGNIQPVLLQAALNPVGNVDAVGAPYSGYIVGPNANGALATQLFAPDMFTYPTSALDYVNLNGSRQLAQLPGGPLSIGVGLQYFHKDQNFTAPPASATGLETQAGGPIYTVGSQEDSSAYVELDALPIKQLELNAAVRYDHYDTYGNSTTPKFGAKFTPASWVSVRGTWGKGFRAPSASEGGQSGALFGAGATNDPVLCPNPGTPTTPGNYVGQCSVFLTGYQVANTQLKAVQSTEYTGGLIFEPSKNFNVSVDYYNIKLTDDIISSFEAGGLTQYISLVRLPGQVLPQYGTPAQCTAAGQAAGCVINTNSAVGPILFATYPYVNGGVTTTSGVDVDAKAHIDIGSMDRLSAELQWTHEISYTELVNGVTYQLAGTHGPSGISGDTGNPKDRGVLTVSWDHGPFDLSTTVNYISSFTSLDPSAGLTSCAFVEAFSGTSAYGARFPFGGAVYPPGCSVARFIDVDLYARYNITKHFDLHASVLNVGNSPPPLDLQTYGGGGELAYDPAMHQIGAVGRFYTAGFTFTL